MNLISPKTKELIEKYYPSESEGVIIQLQEYCEYLSEFFSDETNPETYERFCFAILKLAKSSKEKLKTTIDFAKVDYRDLLVSADFANSITIHNEWARKVLNEKP